MKQLPGITIFGVVCIVLGALGILFAPLILSGLYGGPFFVRGHFPHLHRIFSAWPMAGGYLLSTNVVGTLGSLALLISGIGLLARAGWGRILFFIVAVMKIALVTFSLPPNIVLMRKMYEPLGSPAVMLGTIGGIAYQLLRWIAVVVSRSVVREAFESRALPSVGSAPPG